MIITGNISRKPIIRQSTGSGRTIFLTNQEQIKNQREQIKRNNAPFYGVGTLIRGLLFFGEVLSFAFAPEITAVEVGIGLGFTGLNAGADVLTNGKVNWTNFGIGIATSFVPIVSSLKIVKNKRIVNVEKNLKTLLKTAEDAGIEVEVIASIEKRLNEIEKLKNLVALGKISNPEFLELIRTTNRKIILKVASELDREAFRKLPPNIRFLAGFRRYKRKGLLKFIDFFSTRRGSRLTQFLQLGSSTDASREFVKYFFYKPLSKIAKRLERVLGKPIRDLTEKVNSKLLARLKQGILKNTIPAVASQAFERFRVLNPDMIWVMFSPTNGKYYPPRLVIANPIEIQEFVFRLTEAGSAYDYYSSHFAYSKNGKDLIGLNWSTGALLGSINITAFRNILSVTRNIESVIENVVKKGEIPYISKSWWQSATTTAVRNIERKGGRLAGYAVGGRLGAKFGTAFIKSITNESGEINLRKNNGSYDWRPFAITTVNSAKTYAIMYARRRAITAGHGTAFQDRQTFKRIASVGRRIEGQISHIVKATKPKKRTAKRSRR